LNTDGEQSTDAGRWPWFVLLIIVLCVIAVRWRLLDVPLERDEGEYAYHAQLLLDGVPPYTLVFSMKVPGIVAVYAVILTLFGETHQAVHFGLLLANVGVTVLMFLLGRRVCDHWAGLATAACYAMLSISYRVDGVYANTEQFLLVPAMAGMIIMLRAMESQRNRDFVITGFLFGMALLLKQHAIFLMGSAGLYIAYDHFFHRQACWRLFGKKVLLCLIGPISLWLVMYLLLWWAGVFERFWYFTVEYAGQYVQIIPLSRAFARLWFRGQQLFWDQPCIWSLAAVSLVAMWWHPRLKQHRVFVVIFFVMSFLATTPGFHFRPHYFMLWVPAVALMAGLAISVIAHWSDQRRLPWLPAAILIVCLGVTVFQQRDYLFVYNSTLISRMVHGVNPFPESVKIAKYLRENSPPDATLGIIGSEPQIHFLSKRRSVTGHIYTYPMLENQPFAQKMTDELIRDIEAANPDYLIYLHFKDSWGIAQWREHKIFRWFTAYSYGYETVMMVEVDRKTRSTRYYLDDEAKRKPTSEDWLVVLRRINSQSVSLPPVVPRAPG